MEVGEFLPLLRAHPVTTLRLPKPLTTDEKARLAPVLAERPELEAVCAFLEETGLRAAEFASIRLDEAASWPDPPWYCRRIGCPRHGKTIRIIGKGAGSMHEGGGKERAVVLTPRALRAAAGLVAHAEARNGAAGLTVRSSTIVAASLSPWSDRGLRYVMSRAGFKAGVHLHPHRWRHTYVQGLVDAGVPVETVADMAGHESTVTTRAYFLLSERAKVAALKRRARRVRIGA